MSNKAKTIIRMKRKREDDALDAFLISSNTKRQLTDSTVFSLAESVNVAEFSTITPRRGMKPNLSKSVESKRVVLSSKKIEEARNARYKIVESNRNFTIGNETFTLIDVTRHRAGEESIDSIANMVHGMDVDESKYVYDLYFHDAELPAHEVLDQRVGTL